MEGYKAEHHRLPHEGIYETFDVKKHFPGLPKLGHWSKKFIYKFTNKLNNILFK